MNTFSMDLNVIGCASYNMDNGPLRQLFAIVPSENPDVKGHQPVKLSCEQIVWNDLSADPAAYPIYITVMVKNKTAAGKITQHVVAIQQVTPPAKKAS